MPIANRNLKPGTVLVARYKGKEHRAKVVQTKDGLRYKLSDGKEYASPSSAGAAVKGGGKTCDGWEFWSVEGAAPVPPRSQRKGSEAKPAPRKPRVRATKANSGSGKPKPKRTASRKVKGASNGAKPEAEVTEPAEPPEKPVACGECGAEFPTSRQAAVHMRDAHSSPEAAGNGAR